MPTSKKFTQEQEAEIVQRYQAGEGAQSIGASFGLGGGKSIKRILQTHNVFVEDRRWTGMFSLEDRAEIVRRYQAGENQTELAESYHCTRGNIRNILVRMNAFIRPMGLEEIDARSEMVLRTMRAEGAPVEVIAEHLSVPKYRVQQWIKNLQLPLAEHRPWSRWKSKPTKKGYVYTYVELDDPMRVMAHKEGTILEHRLVMARHLGRPLTRYETVHHKNLNHSDNDISNLQLRQGNHGSGGAFQCMCGCESLDVKLQCQCGCNSTDVAAVPLAEPPKKVWVHVEGQVCVDCGSGDIGYEVDESDLDGSEIPEPLPATLLEA